MQIWDKGEKDGKIYWGWIGLDDSKDSDDLNSE